MAVQVIFQRVRCLARKNFVLGRRLQRSIGRNSLRKAYFKENGAPEEIRTPDPQIRSLVLYPAELRAPLTLR